MASRRLYRSNRDRILGGVAGGLAEYFDVDSTLVRLAWVIIGLAGGFGVLAYIIAWIIMPEEPHDYRWRAGNEGAGAAGGGPAAGPAGSPEGAGRPQAAGAEMATADARWGETHGRDRDRDSEARALSRAWLFGVILVGVGVFLLIRNFVPILWPVPWWPVVLILVGVLVLAGAFRR